MENSLVDGLIFEVAIPMFALGALFAVTVAGFEIVGRIRAKVKGEKWESPIVW